jgi:predicted NAD-dependent protein-ADP-ribosyltransferase YbiA (DUF1768 family)
MDVGSGNKYPSNALSNFAPHPFVFDGVECNSMEGLLQAFKFKNHEMQKYVCTLVGRKAKGAGRKKAWWRRQRLWWKGVGYERESKEYQMLLDRAYVALAASEGFRRALLASGNAVLTHNIGGTDPKKTVLTRREFCRRLTELREGMKER